jgi:DNA-binding MarR family transcriptional regulator
VPNTSVGQAIISIRRLVRVLRLSAQQSIVTAGIGPAQVFVLQQLGGERPLSLNDLAHRTHTDRTSVAEVVERLVQQALVIRAADPSDRRRASVRITAAGRRVLAKSPEAPGTALVNAIRKLTPRDRTALTKSLERLNAALGAANADAPLMFDDVRGPIVKLLADRQFERPARKRAKSRK